MMMSNPSRFSLTNLYLIAEAKVDGGQIEISKWGEKKRTGSPLAPTHNHTENFELTHVKHGNTSC
jgi:hypothetical protein